MAQKYRLRTDDVIEIGGRRLSRLEALADFGFVKKGDLGGYIESEGNLSHEGNCWVYNRACVCEGGHVSGDAQVGCYAVVHGNANVSDNARVLGNVRVFGRAQVCGDGLVSGDILLAGDVVVRDDMSCQIILETQEAADRYKDTMRMLREGRFGGQ